MINWKLRFKNRVTLIAIIALVVSLVYTVLNMIGIIPKFDQQQFIDIANVILDILCLLGIINDPTTTGLGDSERALTYKNPNNDHITLPLTEEDFSEVHTEEDVNDWSK